MIFLFVLIWILASCILFDFRKNNKNSKLINYWTICIALIIISGIKYRVGGDPLSYDDDYSGFPSFYQFANTDFSLLKYEPSFYVIVAFCKLISPEFYIFQIFQAAVITYVVFKFLKANTIYIYSAILLYYILFYFYFMEIMRETFCIALFLISIKYLLHKKYIIYYAISCVAFSIHLSASFLFIIPILYKVCRQGWKKLILIFVAMVMMFGLILKNPLIFIKIIPIKILMKIVSYNLLEIYLPSVILNLIHIVALILLVQLSYKFYNTKDKLWYIPFLKIYILILLATMSVQGIYRLSNYVCVFEIIALVNLIKPIWLRAKKFQVSVCKYTTAISFIIVLKIYSFTMHTEDYSPNTHFYNLYFPYETIFHPVRHPWRENIYYMQQEETWYKKDKNKGTK